MSLSNAAAMPAVVAPPVNPVAVVETAGSGAATSEEAGTLQRFKNISAIQDSLKSIQYGTVAETEHGRHHRRRENVPYRGST